MPDQSALPRPSTAGLGDKEQDLYKKTDPESIKLAKQFKETFARDVVVDFVGVW